MIKYTVSKTTEDGDVVTKEVTVDREDANEELQALLYYVIDMDILDIDS